MVTVFPYDLVQDAEITIKYLTTKLEAASGKRILLGVEKTQNPTKFVAIVKTLKNERKEIEMEKVDRWRTNWKVSYEGKTEDIKGGVFYTDSEFRERVTADTVAKIDMLAYELNNLDDTAAWSDDANHFHRMDKSLRSLKEKVAELSKNDRVELRKRLHANRQSLIEESQFC